MDLVGFLIINIRAIGLISRIWVKEGGLKVPNHCSTSATYVLENTVFYNYVSPQASANVYHGIEIKDEVLENAVLKSIQ